MITLKLIANIDVDVDFLTEEKQYELESKIGHAILKADGCWDVYNLITIEE